MKKLVFSALLFSAFALEAPYVFAQTPQELFNRGYRQAQQMYDNGEFDATTRRNMSITCQKIRNGQPIDTTIPNLYLAQKKYALAGATMWSADWLKKNCSPD